MSEHGCVSTLELDSVDVYKVAGSTFTITPDPDPALPPSVVVTLDDDDLQNAYSSSCAPAMISYDDFKLDAQNQTNAIASAEYNGIANINNVNPTVFRVAQVRVCINLGWVQIYVIWHI